MAGLPPERTSHELTFHIRPRGYRKDDPSRWEIQDYVRGETGRKAFLLVPDQGTYTAEYLLAKSFPGEGFTDVTVCGFSRLAYRVFQELHSPVAEALSPLGQEIIVRRILDEKKDELQMIVKVASHPHFSEEVRLLLHQLDLFCVTENDLLLAAEEEGDTPLGRKMKDLSIIYTAYNEYLHLTISIMKATFSTFWRTKSPSPT